MITHNLTSTPPRPAPPRPPQVDAQAVIIEEDVKTLGAQMGAVARLLLIADFLQETSIQPLLLLKLKTKLESLLRGRFIYDSRCGAARLPDWQSCCQGRLLPGEAAARGGCCQGRLLPGEAAARGGCCQGALACCAWAWAIATR
jgi:hypothetical protein